jgi:hypothetical protein
LTLVHRAGLSFIFFYLTLAALIISPSILSARAVTPSYLPAVTPGQFAQYKVLKDSCQSLIPQVCTLLRTSLNDTSYTALQVVGVSTPSPPSVTLQLLSIFKNGTGAHRGALVNVATGASNVTLSSIAALSLGSNDYFLLAGGLVAPNQIWNIASAPKFNRTVNEIILGSSRNVNFLNYSAPGSYQGVGFREFLGFAFDQSSGFLVDINVSIRTIIPGTVNLDFEIAMVDNNVWGNAHMPDFSLGANPTRVSIVGDNSGNSIITLQRLYGYSGTVGLSATVAAGISCSFSTNSLVMGGSDRSTLSCKGSAGTYTVTVEGRGGYSTHNTAITFVVSALPKPTQPASNLSMPLVYGGIGIAGIAAALIAFLVFKRKNIRAGVAPGDTSLPSEQA